MAHVVFGRGGHDSVTQCLVEQRKQFQGIFDAKDVRVLVCGGAGRVCISPCGDWPGRVLFDQCGWECGRANVALHLAELSFGSVGVAVHDVAHDHATLAQCDAVRQRARQEVPGARSSDRGRGGEGTAAFRHGDKLLNTRVDGKLFWLDVDLFRVATLHLSQVTAIMSEVLELYQKQLAGYVAPAQAEDKTKKIPVPAKTFVGARGIEFAYQMTMVLLGGCTISRSCLC